MGRKKNEDIEEREPYGTAIDDILEQFEEDVDICGRIYRITTPVDSIGKPSREAVGKVDSVVDEDYIGRTFGSGSYLLKYTIKDSKRTEYKSITMHIGKEYDKFRMSPQAEPVKQPAVAFGGGMDLGGILGSLTLEKLTVIGGLVKAVKEFLAPPQPQVDMTKLLELAISNRQQNVSDAVLVKCLDGMQKQNTPPSITQQLTEFKALKDAFQGELSDNNEEEKGDTMNFLLEKAFELLPDLLQKKNNDYRAVGQEVRENPFVKNIIKSDPELMRKFFETAVDKCGVEAANQLALGFGYQVSQQTAQQQQTENVENE